MKRQNGSKAAVVTRNTHTVQQLATRRVCLPCGYCRPSSRSGRITFQWRVQCAGGTVAAALHSSPEHVACVNERQGIRHHVAKNTQTSATHRASQMCDTVMRVYVSNNVPPAISERWQNHQKSVRLWQVHICSPPLCCCGVL